MKEKKSKYTYEPQFNFQGKENNLEKRSQNFLEVGFLNILAY